MIIEDKNILTEDEIKVIDEYIMGRDFPWYHTRNSIRNDNVVRPFFVHIVLSRPEDHEDGINDPLRVNSNFYPWCKEIVTRFIKEQGISENPELWRMAINDTLALPMDHYGIHRDHDDVDHWNLIVYLTDSTGDTVIYDDDGNEVRRSTPERGKAICWDGMAYEHTHECKETNFERRIVLVATFKKED